MGNKFDAESVRSNLSNYKLDVSHLLLVSSTIYSQNETVLIWKNRVDGMRLVQRKYFLRTGLQFYNLLEMFALRYNNPFLLATKYLNVESDVIEKMNTSNVFSDTWVSIFYEESISSLSHFREIPQQDAAYFLLQSLKGFERLVEKTQFAFQVKESMFLINQSRQIKVWICQSAWQHNANNLLRPLASQCQMIRQILQIIQKNIFFCTESHKNLQQKVQNDMNPIVIQQTLRRAPQTIKEAIQMIEKHLQNDEVKVGKQMSCLKDLDQDQLSNILKMRQLKNFQTSSLTQCSVPQQNFTISKTYDPLSQNAAYVTNENSFKSKSYRTGQTIETNTKSIPRNFSLQNIESTTRQINNSSGINISREKSNKKSGLSLVKHNEKTKTQHNRNHTSMLVVKPRPSSNYNQQSVVTVQNNSGKIHINNKNSSKQNSKPFDLLAQNRQFPMQRSNSLLKNQKSKGITITHRNDSLKKSKNAILGQNSDKQKIKLSLQGNGQHHSSILKSNNQNGSLIQNNQSTISIGTFPPPLYVNNSLVRPYVPNQNVFNQTISSNASFDPLLPNQSLTRFHKEFVMNPNAISSGQDFYEIPKIYVHSPKAKNKIFKTETFSSGNHSQEHNFLVNQFINENHQRPTVRNEARKDFVKEWQEEEIDRKNNKFEEYQSYIHENESVFTHPVLYEYITNNSNGFNETQPLPTQQKKSYIDHLANVQISESLDYNTAEKLFQAKNQSHVKEKLKNLKDISPQHYSINDFPTIEQIEENLNDENLEKQNVSFLPIPLNLTPQTNFSVPQSTLNHRPPSTVRRGYEESVVVEYKKYYDDTNRSNNSPNKHYFSPLKKNNKIMNQAIEPQKFQDNKKYGTANNWRTSPSKELVQRPSSVHAVIYQNKPIGRIQDHRNRSPSPMSKIIYKGEKPAINPLLMQDIEKFRQHRMF